MDPNPMKLYCQVRAADPTWMDAVIPYCYGIEFFHNTIDADWTEVSGDSPPTGYKKFMYKLAVSHINDAAYYKGLLWGVDLTNEGDYIHHALLGSQVIKTGSTDTATNALCVGSADPYSCCTGSGTGTCKLCKTVTWTGCADDTGEACASTSRIDVLERVGSTTVCGPDTPAVDVGAAYWNKAEDYLYFIDPGSSNLRNLIDTEIARISEDACTGAGTCPMNGTRIDEMPTSYGVDGIPFTDCIEFTSVESYGESLRGMLASAKSAHPDFIIAPGLSYWFEAPTWLATIERSLITAAGGMATERMAGLPYPDACSWSGSTCNIVGSGYTTGAYYDAALDMIATLSYIMASHDNPNLTILFVPFTVGRGASCLQALCRSLDDACYFGIATATSDVGDLPPFVLNDTKCFDNP